jgi:hypothetical protein
MFNNAVDQPCNDVNVIFNCFLTKIAIVLSWVRSQHPPTQWNLRGAADEAVLLNKVDKKEKNPSLKRIDCWFGRFA